MGDALFEREGFSVVGNATIAKPTSDLIQQRFRAVYMTFDHIGCRLFSHITSTVTFDRRTLKM